MTKVQPQSNEQHGLLPIINTLFTRLRSRPTKGFPHFDTLDSHTEEDIGFHRDGRLHEKDEWRF
ncbi:hypothetical protein DTW90_11320 [Neorhizobium sp. P12A]|jgi:hypothetical protein|uniref:hypothetical protein n=1 Tax=Rhizobium/Agrobacterium group TaxID=227290 RepID=UPI00104F66C7|nr:MULTISPECIES: hypothetical protein [Rhizobium/Agrobacterium group]KAA0699898.1 hypothetical protein DTW90_11320 [Neorhizobium sp. P12A]TCR93256.1 hypothetical protein EV561_101702 [Rhizobium sp. BK376]